MRNKQIIHALQQDTIHQNLVEEITQHLLSQVFKGRKVDLWERLFSWSQEKVAVNFPEYSRTRPGPVMIPGSTLISPENRHGVMVGAVSNQNTFTFSVRVVDRNVLVSRPGSLEFGDYRNFAITSATGDLANSWSALEIWDHNGKFHALMHPNTTPQPGMKKGKITTPNSFLREDRWELFGKMPFGLLLALDERLSTEIRALPSQHPSGFESKKSAAPLGGRNITFRTSSRTAECENLIVRIAGFKDSNPTIPAGTPEELSQRRNLFRKLREQVRYAIRGVCLGYSRRDWEPNSGANLVKIKRTVFRQGSIPGFPGKILFRRKVHTFQEAA